MKSISLVSVCFVAALGIAAPQAHAQNANNLAGRVAALEQALAAQQAAIATLQNNINSEAAARTAADTALNARASKLEGSLTADDFIGTTYSIYLLGIAMDPPGSEAPFNQLASYAQIGTAMLAGDFTGFLNGEGAGIVMTEQAANLNWTNEGSVGAGSGNFDWSYNNGKLSVRPHPGVAFNDFDLSVAAGGQMLVTAKGGRPSNNQQLTVWVRNP